MKKTNKILISILVLVTIMLIVLIVFKKQDTKQPVIAEQSSSDLLLQSETDNSIADISNDTSDTVTTKVVMSEISGDNYSTTNRQNTITTTKKYTDNKVNTSPKTYDLSDAKKIKTQRTSFGELSLYSTESGGKSIYLLVHVNKNNNKIFYEIPGKYIIENIYYANVDGRFGDEILIRANTGSNIEPRKFETYVLKVNENEFTPLLSSSEISKFTKTFTAEIKADSNITIINKSAGFSKTINLKNSNNNILPGKSSDVKFENSYYGFEPRDVDEDGIYEIVCTQYTSIGSKTNFIGYASTTLKFNYDTKNFEIMAADFYAAN